MSNIQTQGIIFGDIFINNKQLFKDLFQEHFKINQGNIETSINILLRLLNNLEQTVTSENALRFEQAWKVFQRNVLLNQKDLEILIAYRNNSEGTQVEVSNIVKQKDIQGTTKTPYGTNYYGIQAGHDKVAKVGSDIVDDAKAIEQAERIENYVRNHLSGFLNQLNENIGQTNASILYNYHQQYLSYFMKHKGPRQSLANMPWRRAFYEIKSTNINRRIQGRAYDAFFNHLANYNKSIFQYLKSQGKKNITLSNFNSNKTVYTEEGPVNFAKLLHESKNNTAWYTGGDIVIVNPKNMQIVYNIQLKSTISKQKASTFPIKINALKSILNNFKQNQNPQEMAEYLYKNLLTSISNSNSLNSANQKDIDQIIRKGIVSRIYRNK